MSLTVSPLQVRVGLWRQHHHHLSTTTTATEDDGHLQAPLPMATPSPASGFPSLWILRRSAGQAGSSRPADTTPTTAKAPVHSLWAAASGPLTTPRCAPSCTPSVSRPMKWAPPAACLTHCSPSVCCILTMRKMWC